MFKIGDKVVDVIRGKGVVTSIVEDKEYPITVAFKSNTCRRYTLDGKFYISHSNPSLFHAKGYKPPVGGKPNRKPKFKHDEVILVQQEEKWVPRHFSNWEDDKVWCYDNGCSSKTSEYTTRWDEYKKYDR